VIRNISKMEVSGNYLKMEVYFMDVTLQQFPSAALSVRVLLIQHCMYFQFYMMEHEMSYHFIIPLKL
jgi:hypothetical protein